MTLFKTTISPTVMNAKGNQMNQRHERIRRDYAQLIEATALARHEDCELCESL